MVFSIRNARALGEICLGAKPAIAVKFPPRCCKRQSLGRSKGPEITLGARRTEAGRLD
jgi:hypothetical protein